MNSSKFLTEREVQFGSKRFDLVNPFIVKNFSELNNNIEKSAVFATK